jgi:molecular chaperone GrpE
MFGLGIGDDAQEGRSTKTKFVSVKELEKLKKMLEDERKKTGEYLSRLQYLQADFENLQKRSKKEIEQAVEYGNESLIVKLLPVLDDLERGLEAAREAKDKEPILDGLELILKEIQTSLREAGLSSIECIGKNFDPSSHEAMGYVETADKPENTVIRELRKGYRLGDKVIRPSMVEVARSPES